MRRLVFAMSVTILLIALAAVPVSGAPIKVEKPSLVTAVCLWGDQMRVRSDWSGQVISNPNAGPTFTWTFKGMGLPASPATIPFIGPTSDPSFVQVDLNKFIVDAGPIEWNSWSAITTSATSVDPSVGVHVHRRTHHRVKYPRRQLQTMHFPAVQAAPGNMAARLLDHFM